MKGIAYPCNEVTTTSMLRVQVTENKYKGLKNLVDDGWVSCRIRFGADNQIILYLAIGEFMRQGKIVVSSDTNLDIIAEMLDIDGLDFADEDMDDGGGADSGAGMEG